jgi:hypothetical protein
MVVEIRHKATREIIRVVDAADLWRADLSGADLSGTDLYGADLGGANLRGAKLYGATLCNAYLCNANLIGADLRDADLSGTNLCGTDLYGADLYGAKLWRADLSGTDLIDGGQRRDGHRFVGWIKDGILQIRAGCRDFSIADARAHWIKTRAGTPLGDETMAILDHIERVARIRGLLMEKGDEVATKEDSNGTRGEDEEALRTMSAANARAAEAPLEQEIL